MGKKRIAIVVVRYGEEVDGGAEQLARWLAESLTDQVEIEVITTCALDYGSWTNHFPSGESELNGVTIKRFAVDVPRAAAIDSLTRRIRFQTHDLEDEIAWVRAQGPYSSTMLRYIKESHDRVDFFIFVTYLYAPTFFGLPLVADKAILIPTAHEEWYVRLPVFRALFSLPRLVVYLTEPEMAHVHKATGNEQVPGVVVGVGLDTPVDISAARFREKYDLDGPFLIYVGRIDEAKNVPELLEFFTRFQQEYGRDLKLVLLGKAHFPLPQHPDIVSLGFVSEQDKYDALQASTLLIIPSKLESLSIVALEAWQMKKPVLANGQCAVLKDQCRRSNGGLYYHTYDEFVLTLRKMLDHPHLRSVMGRQGSRFVAQNYDWRIILAQYQAIFAALSELSA